MQDVREGDQEQGMDRLQQAIRKMHLQEEIGEIQKALTSENKIGTVLPAIEVGNSIPGRRVVAVLERLARTHGLHQVITADNGTEFTSRAVETVRRGLTYVPDRRAG